MCNGGRIVHHLKNYLPSKNNTLLFVSYLAVGSLGRLLHDGERAVNIMGEKISVEAEIEKIGGYSSHADLNGLLGFAAKSGDTLKSFCDARRIEIQLVLGPKIERLSGN